MSFELKEIFNLITDEHIEKYGYSGALIRVLRITHGVTRAELAKHFRKRKGTVEKWESTDKIGIKLAKDLATIFKLEDWRILRDKEKYIEIVKKE